MRVHPDFQFEFQLSEIPPLPPLAGDYNRNGIVDAADYVVWRKTIGSSSDLMADGSGDGVVDVRDYHYWRFRFGNTNGGNGQSLTQVPEPSGLLMFMLGVAAWLSSPVGHRRRS